MNSNPLRSKTWKKKTRSDSVSGRPQLSLKKHPFRGKSNWCKSHLRGRKPISWPLRSASGRKPIRCRKLRLRSRLTKSNEMWPKRKDYKSRLGRSKGRKNDLPKQRRQKSWLQRSWQPSKNAMSSETNQPPPLWPIHQSKHHPLPKIAHSTSTISWVI